MAAIAHGLMNAPRLALALALASLLLGVPRGFGSQPGQTSSPTGVPELRCVPLERALNPPPSIPTSQDVRHIKRANARESSLFYSAAVADEIVDVGRVVDFTLAIKNSGGSPVVLSFSTAQRVDVVIWNDDCIEVWRWSRGSAFAQVTQSLSVPAGGATVFHIPWEQRDQVGHAVPIGAYEARVVFLGTWANRNMPLVLPPLVFAVR
jgi:hypothetical protein